MISTYLKKGYCFVVKIFLIFASKKLKYYLKISKESDASTTFTLIITDLCYIL